MTATSMEEAPASPRSAAIHYWGGDWSDDALNVEGNKGVNESHRWDETKDEANYADLYESTFQRRTSFQRRRISAVKFQLTLQDEGDDDHWMFARPPLPVPNLPTPPTEEKEEEEEEASIPEPAAVDNNDFANPNFEGDDCNAIPVVDLSQPKHVYAQQIGDACRNMGFFYIINHGVDQEVMDGVLDKSKKFFELDLESKLEISNGSGGGNDLESSGKKGYRGYFGIGGEDLDNKDGTRDLLAEEGAGSKQNETKDIRKHTAGDFKEGFDCGLESNHVSSDDARIKFFGENLWPDEPNNASIIGFRKTLMKYQAELIGLSDKLLLALGESLNDAPNGGDDVAEDYFVSRSRSPMCTLRLLHYPPTNNEGASQGCGAHTDYGLFTVLQQDSIGGLQVRNRNKHWIDAKPLKGSFVINVGDMLSHWTNGEYASTVHRVVSPSTCRDRYSVPFFFNPDHDAVVKPLGRVGLDGSEKSGNDGKTALEILVARYDGTFQKSK
mmetsp:Transcript_37088/g.66810  ORF Transcript_37088/g.66810 Transcript_37088/m.66810 type:complete len:497 (-) Transcript_37088:126-1616(-)|eukprot:CAMPEP_0201925120 /NCGR_PEP_ID=MMETSP0903-20130614/14129_1 /ASSEMBLY_ACC=CAM_ASM_000552 /TAXON_ID=420261 /ORGANISM="Thalassiosira antarctica, Strain CCMP982" /LENGTH=496 /DNA_ID=CAMNT_0048462743 /DNA_START=45 /DNA_END=1535 /DNA_ORIENTATION=-